MGASQILERLVYIIARKIVTESTLNLQKSPGLIGCYKVNLLSGEAPVLRVNAIPARCPRSLVDLVKEIARRREPKHIVRQSDG